LANQKPKLANCSAKVKDLGQSVKTAAEDELRYELIRFAARTTAHGIPMVCQNKWTLISISLENFFYLITILFNLLSNSTVQAAQATRWYAKWMWICISLLSMAIFIWSVLGVFEKFQRKEKIVSVQASQPH
jgi:hypothetical protein